MSPASCGEHICGDGQMDDIAFFNRWEKLVYVVQAQDNEEKAFLLPYREDPLHGAVIVFG